MLWFNIVYETLAKATKIAERNRMMSKIALPSLAPPFDR